MISGDAGEQHESGGASGGSSEAGVASSSIPGGDGGNRWPRQETLALLKIRSDMGAAFRDSSLKAPLWEEISRKMAEMGYQRSAKKCKEKFENVFKYHKRTKDGRSSKSDGKTYRFFDQLQALEQAAAVGGFPPPPQQMPPILPHSSSMSPNPVSMVLPTVSMPNPVQNQGFHPPVSGFFNTTSSTSSDEDIQPPRRGKKRKWKDFFRRLMKDVIRKQEELQATFLETLECRDRDRAAREEAWRVQERARVSREQELLQQERSMAAAKDAALIAFLKNVSDQHNLQQIPITLPTAQPPAPQLNQETPPPIKIVERLKSDQIGDNSSSSTSSRWPKNEVEALVKLRTNLNLKYQETGPKGPLWEEISAAMSELGYNRSSKRCKQKWENINKYFKKVKESNKNRPQDSKTCPYFHQLDAIYRERVKVGLPAFSLGQGITPDESPIVPIMAQPEQHWPLLPEQPPKPADSAMPDRDRDRDSCSEDDDDGGDEGEEEDEGGGEAYEIVANKQQPG